MYCSLDRADIELAVRDGRKRFVQVDPRDAAEMLSRRPLSTAIVLVRCLNPRRLCQDLDLFYNCRHEPPRFMVEAVSVAGAHLWGGTDPSFVLGDFPVREPDQTDVDELANTTFAALGSELAEKVHCDSLTLALERLERDIETRGFPDEDDPGRFWTTILELGALSARAIHETNGGSWTYDAKAVGTFPFTYRCPFQGEVATINPLGKALKFIRGKGGGDEPSALVRMLASAAR